MKQWRYWRNTGGIRDRYGKEVEPYHLHLSSILNFWRSQTKTKPFFGIVATGNQTNDEEAEENLRNHNLGSIGPCNDANNLNTLGARLMNLMNDDDLNLIDPNRVLWISPDGSHHKNPNSSQKNACSRLPSSCFDLQIIAGCDGLLFHDRASSFACW